MDSQDVEVVQEKTAILRTYRAVWYILGIIETLLFFRFLFRLPGANPRSGFVALIYAISAPMIAPFLGIYPTPVIDRSVFEWQSLIAMLVYMVVAYFIVRFFHVVKPVKRREVERKVEEL